MFKILSIDGGGIRGIYPACILKKIQNDSGIIFSDYFDLIVGTSTGSIIAGALAVGYPIEKIVDLYKTEAGKIFKKKRMSFHGLLSSRYNNKYLRQKLNDVFKDSKLSDTRTGLIIPSTDIGNGRVFVFKSSFHPEFTRDKNILIKDAVMSSCSAPFYFDPVTYLAPEYWGKNKSLEKYLLIDGGLWANNPSVVALTEAFGRRFKKDREDVMLMSIGTGIGNRYYSGSRVGWGFLTGWESSKIIDSIFNIQSQTNNNIINLILPSENYLRINFEKSDKLSLDDVKSIPDLISQADNDYLSNKESISDFLIK